MSTMRIMSLASAAILALLTATSAAAQAQPGSWFYGTGGCADAIMDAQSENMELYVWKLRDSGEYTDILFDLSTRGSFSIGGADLGTGAGGFAPNFKFPDADEDVHFIVATFPDDRIYVNSGTIGDAGGALMAANVQTMGLSFPSDWMCPGCNGTGETAETVGSTSGVSFQFPVIAEWHPMLDGEIVMGCRVGGTAPDPATGAGPIFGYNIYRAESPTQPPRGAGEWHYFAATGDFDLTVDEEFCPGCADPNPLGDLVGVVNTDAERFSGDERFIFSDATRNPDGTDRFGGERAEDGVQYWYTIQPVIGRIFPADLDGVTLAAAGESVARAYDLNNDGTMDAVDIDGDPSVMEFLSPQADAGIPGLGLTNSGIAACPPYVEGMTNPASAFGGVSFDARRRGGEVDITFSAALMSGDVLGFNVYRLTFGDRVRINDQVILATGLEGSAYSLVDTVGRSRRTRRVTSSVEYVVEIVYADGTPSQTVGPFTPDDEGSSRRDRRSRNLTRR